MGKKSYIGDTNSVARRLKKLYIGDANNIARKIKKLYIGDENGIARCIHSSGIDYAFVGIAWYMEAWGTVYDSEQSYHNDISKAIIMNDNWEKAGNAFWTYATPIYSEDGKYLISSNASGNLASNTHFFKWNGTNGYDLEFTVVLSDLKSTYEPFISSNSIDYRSLSVSEDSSKFVVAVCTKTTNGSYYNLNSNLVVYKIQNGNAVVDKIYTGVFSYIKGYSISITDMTASPDLSIVALAGHYRKTSDGSYYRYRVVVKLNADGTFSTLLSESSTTYYYIGYFTEDGKYYIQQEKSASKNYNVYYITGGTLTLVTTIAFYSTTPARMIYSPSKQLLHMCVDNIVYFYRLSETGVTYLGKYTFTNETDYSYFLSDVTDNGLYGLKVEINTSNGYAIYHLAEIALSRNASDVITGYTYYQNIADSYLNTGGTQNDSTFNYARYVGA